MEEVVVSSRAYRQTHNQRTRGAPRMGQSFLQRWDLHPHVCTSSRRRWGCDWLRHNRLVLLTRIQYHHLLVVSELGNL